MYYSYLLAALEWSVTNQNLDPSNPLLVISMSLGSGVYTTTCDAESPVFTTVVANAVAAGITTFISSANDANKSAIAFPACLSKVISVGAVYDANIGSVGFAVCSDPTTAADQVACYSNSASFLGLLGPAFDAATLAATGNGSAQYDPQFGGTSAAAPYVAGAAAVLQSVAKDKLGRYLTPEEVKQYLTVYGDPITDSANSITTPRVNLGRAAGALNPGLDTGTVLSPMYKLLL
jgi:subtilisin family serine protease